MSDPLMSVVDGLGEPRTPRAPHSSTFFARPRVKALGGMVFCRLNTHFQAGWLRVCANWRWSQGPCIPCAPASVSRYEAPPI